MVISEARTRLEKLHHLEKCDWSETILMMEPSLNMRGVFVGKLLDRADEFLMLTPTGAMKTRCVRRLEGDNAWDLKLLNQWLAVFGMHSKEHAAETNNPNKRMSWKAADVQKRM